MNLVGQCIRFREMVISFTRRDLRQRYVGSVLGWPWPFIQPLIMLAVYYLVFNVLLEQRLSEEITDRIAALMGGTREEVKSFQVVLLCCGLIPWLMTAEYVMRGCNLILESGNMVKKVAFPAEILPVSLLFSYLLNMMILFGVFIAATWLLTPFWSPLIWLFPVVVVVHAVFLLGLAYLFATANVFVRDVGQLLPIFVNLWFFLSPIVYMKESLVDADGNPKPWIWVFDFNPMTYLVDLYRWTLVYPDQIRYTVAEGGGAWVKVELVDVMRELAIFGVVAAATFFIGYRVFMANKHKFADEL